MPCTKQASKKYTERNSPPYPANECRAGTRKRGNDGLYYVAKPNVNGVKRWVKSSKTSKSSFRHPNAVRRPCKKQTSKRFTQRNSPPYLVDDCHLGTKKRGNDGLWYIAGFSGKRKRFKWLKYDTSTITVPSTGKGRRMKMYSQDDNKSIVAPVCFKKPKGKFMFYVKKYKQFREVHFEFGTGSVQWVSTVKHFINNGGKIWVVNNHPTSW